MMKLEWKQLMKLISEFNKKISKGMISVNEISWRNIQLNQRLLKLI